MEPWPALPYEDWRDTRDTLHMYTQIIGKLRLALAPFEPQWGNVPLYITARGLTTSPVPVGLRTFDAEFDLVGHELVIRTSDGAVELIKLEPRAVADFHHDVTNALGRLGIDVAIAPGPSEVDDPIPFGEDRTHHSYDAAAVNRFFRVLSQVAVVFKEHRARFRGRTTPAHFFWGSFDMAVTRYSGQPAEPPPGANIIMRLSEDAEQVCAGFWPGHPPYPHPAFFSYAYPKPDGIASAQVRPAQAAWDESQGLFILPYDDARVAPDPRRAILDFLESTYEAGASGLGWSTELVPD